MEVRSEDLEHVLSLGISKKKTILTLKVTVGEPVFASPRFFISAVKTEKQGQK